MTAKEAIDVLFNEWKCIDRNDGIHCDRKCETCDLVMDVGIIREAFNMAISALEAQELSKNSTKLDKENGDLQPTCNRLATDTISRQEVLESFRKICNICGKDRKYAGVMCRACYLGDAIDIVGESPSAHPDGWLEQNKDKILQAGMEGREIDFRIGGRLFAIREKAQ